MASGNQAKQLNIWYGNQSVNAQKTAENTHTHMQTQVNLCNTGETAFLQIWLETNNIHV